MTSDDSLGDMKEGRGSVSQIFDDTIYERGLMQLVELKSKVTSMIS